MIYVYEGKVCSGKTRQMLKDLQERKILVEVAIDEGERFLENHPNFNFYAYNEWKGNLAITFQKIPRDFKNKYKNILIIRNLDEEK